MRRRLKELKSNSLVSYILVFSLMVMVIILVMGGYLYRFYYRTIYDDFVNTNETYLTGIMNRHESDMDIMENIVQQVGLEPSLTEFMLKENPVKSMQLKDRLYQYDAVSQSFIQMFSIYHEDNYLFSHATSAELDRFLREGLVLENTRPKELETLLYSSESGMKVLPQQEVNGYLAIRNLNGVQSVVIYIFPVAPKNITTLMFVVGEKYYDNLLKEDGTKRNDYIIYKGQNIVSNGTIEEVLEEDVAVAVQKMKSNYERITLAGTKYLLVQKTGESGLVYCTLQPISEFQKKMLTGIWGIILLLLACSIPAAFLITTVSHNMFSRVKQINSLLNEEEHYNLESIEEGIRGLIQSQSVEQKRNLSLKKIQFLRLFIQEQFADYNDMLTKAKEADIHAQMPFYVIAMMGDRGNSNEKKAHELMLEAIRNETLIDGYGMSLLNSNENLYVIFGENRESLDIIVRFFLLIGKDYCEDFVLAVSDYHTDIHEASKAYLESKTAYDHRFLMDASQVISYQNVSATERTQQMSDVYLQLIRNAIYSDNQEEIHLVVEDICKQLQGSNQSVLNLRLFCNDIIKMVNKEWNMEESKLNEIYNVFTLSQCLTIQDFHDILDQLCEDLMQYRNGAAGNSRKKQSDLVKDAMQYMKEHYAEYELNMSSLAEYLKVTPVTLAVEFKKCTDLSPSDYLAIIRMEAAKELLKNTDKLVREISHEVGYEDEHVFMRRFKKYTGRTPLQYRGNA